MNIQVGDFPIFFSSFFEDSKIRRILSSRVISDRRNQIDSLQALNDNESRQRYNFININSNW